VAPELLPHYVAIAADLREITQTSSVFEVVPAVRRLKEELHTANKSHGQLQALVHQLCSALAISSTDALVSSAQDMVKQRTAGIAQPPHGSGS